MTAGSLKLSFLAVALPFWLLVTSRTDARVSFSTQEQPEFIGVDSIQAIAIGDLDGDGFDDLVSVNDLDGVTVYLNDGEGGLDADADYETAFDGGPVAVAIGLFNDDAIPDVVAANNLSGTVSVLLGIGDGELDDTNDPFQVRVGDSPIGIGVGDLNNDRFDDLAILSGDLVYLLRNNRDGTFSAFNPATVSTRSDGDSFAVAVGLLNADANLDFAVTNRDRGQVVTYIGNGDGTFVFGQFLPAGDSPTGIIVADADGDMNNDILVVDSGALPFDEVRLILNTGDSDINSLFSTNPESIVSGEAPFAIAALDVEPDGKVDLAVTTVMMDQASLLCQPSDKCDTFPGIPLEAGIFRPPFAGTILGCRQEGQIAIVSGKLNDDDMDDLVALSGDLDTLCVMINTSVVGTPTPDPTVTVTPSVTPTPTPTVAASPTSTRGGFSDSGCAIKGRSDGRAVVLMIVIGLIALARGRLTGRSH